MHFAVSLDSYLIGYIIRILNYCSFNFMQFHFLAARLVFYQNFRRHRSLLFGHSSVSPISSQKFFKLPSTWKIIYSFIYYLLISKIFFAIKLNEYKLLLLTKQIE
jgi:hypothetical protein